MSFDNINNTVWTLLGLPISDYLLVVQYSTQEWAIFNMIFLLRNQNYNTYFFSAQSEIGKKAQVDVRI